MCLIFTACVDCGKCFHIQRCSWFDNKYKIYKYIYIYIPQKPLGKHSFFHVKVRQRIHVLRSLRRLFERFPFFLRQGGLRTLRSKSLLHRLALHEHCGDLFGRMCEVVAGVATPMQPQTVRLLPVCSTTRSHQRAGSAHRQLGVLQRATVCHATPPALVSTAS